MKIFTATENVTLLGDKDEKYGQTYWGNVEEQEMPVRFNLMQVVDIMPGRKFTAEETEVRKAKSGKDYMQLKKVKLSDPAPVHSGDIPEFDLDEPLEEAVDEQLPESPSDDGSLAVPTASTHNAAADEAPSYEAGTNARWALKLSTDTYKSVMGRVPEDESDWNTIEDFAKWLLGSFSRLKNFNPGDEPAVSGYKKAQASARRLKKEEE